MQNKTKICPYCKAEIDKNVEHCPNCKKAQPVSKASCLTAIIVVFVMCVLPFKSVIFPTKNKDIQEQQITVEEPVAETIEPITETEPVDEKIIEMVSERSELKDTTAGNIMKYFVKHDAPNLGGYRESDEKTNPAIGKNGLVSSVGFFVTTAEKIDPDDPFCGSIEAFENAEIAKNRCQMIKDYIKNKLAKDEYLYLNGCVLMRIKLDVPFEDEQKYERLLDEYMNGNFISEDITEPTTETITEAATESETEVTTKPETEAETEPPTGPKPLIGKDIDTIDTFHYNGAVRNDVTGDWKCAVFAESGINVAEYAVSYYDKYMSGSDTEIDAVINLSDKTTTKIVQAIAPEKLALTVYQYVQGEEHDAKLMFSGQVLAYYMVNKETGEITEE